MLMHVQEEPLLMKFRLSQRMLVDIFIMIFKLHAFHFIFYFVMYFQILKAYLD